MKLGKQASKDYFKMSLTLMLAIYTEIGFKNTILVFVNEFLIIKFSCFNRLQLSNEKNYHWAYTN